MSAAARGQDDTAGIFRLYTLFLGKLQKQLIHITRKPLTECFCRLAASPCSVLWPSVVSSVFFRITHSINSRSDNRMPFQWSLLDSSRLLDGAEKGNLCRWLLLLLLPLTVGGLMLVVMYIIIWLSLIGFKFTVSRCFSTLNCSSANSSRPGVAAASPHPPAR